LSGGRFAVCESQDPPTLPPPPARRRAESDAWLSSASSSSCCFCCFSAAALGAASRRRLQRQLDAAAHKLRCYERQDLRPTGGRRRRTGRLGAAGGPTFSKRCGSGAVLGWPGSPPPA
jgi:hypothetical protein